MTPGEVIARVAGDPLLTYALLAAAVLALAAVGGGIARGELRSLARAGTWTAAALAAIAALAIVAVADVVQLGAGADWPLPGLRRLPLYLVAIGYGPIPGIVAAAMFAGVERLQGPLPAAEAVLVLEVAVVGWLAIAPSPRRWRWAASFAILVGWAMATATAGVAALAWLHRPLPAELATASALADLPGVAAAAALVALAPPGWWRRAAPAPRPAGGGGEDGELHVPALRRPSPRRERGRMEAPRLPPELAREGANSGPGDPTARGDGAAADAEGRPPDAPTGRAEPRGDGTRAP